MASIVVESVENELLRYYRHPALTNATIEALKRDLSNTKFPKINHIDTEYLFLIHALKPIYSIHFSSNLLVY